MSLKVSSNLTTQSGIDLRKRRQRQNQLSSIIRWAMLLDRIAFEVDGGQFVHVRQLVDLTPVGDLQFESRYFFKDDEIKHFIIK